MHRVGSIADIIVVLFLFPCSHMFRYFIWSLDSGCHPQYYNHLRIYFFYNYFWKICRNNGVIVTKNLFLNFINLLFLYSFYRTDCYTVLFLHTNENVSAAHIVKIIGKGTYTMINVIRIPSCFKFNSVGFHATLV